MTELRDIPVSDLHAHPDNPRLRLRDDVVTQIAAEITRSGFGQEHALLVRPNAGGYEILSGHHRHEAAKRCALDTVPCWVGDMDDNEAFMQLVLSNTQGELTPLEIGIHALDWQGEQQSYAERVGFGKSYISQLRSAAEVAVYSSKPAGLDDKAKHLYEVSKAPSEAWPAIANALVAQGWSVADTAKRVESVKQFDVPERYADWLPLGEVVDRFLEDEFSPRTVARLIAQSDEASEWIAKNSPDQAPTFESWLVENRGGDSWDHRQIIEYQARLMARRHDVTGWHLGDWRDHLGELAEGCVGLVLTDPPYGMDYQSGYRNVSHDRIASDSPAAAKAETVQALIALRPKLTDDAHVLVFCTWRNEADIRTALDVAGYTVRGSLVWAKNNTSMGNLDGTFAPKHERIVHAVKGDPKLYRRVPDVLEADREPTDRHPTEKPTSLLAELIEATTAAGQIVADPFAGVASTCVAAKETGRKWWGCELVEGYWKLGEERLS